jgi:hypothetical protein
MRQVGFPDALGEPEAVDLDAEPALQSLAVTDDLLDPVLGSKRHEDRLVVTRREEFDPAGVDLPSHPIDPVRGVVLQPVEQWPREMDRHRADLAVAEAVQQRGIDCVEVVAEDVIEVPHRLVEMEAKAEAEGFSHGHLAAGDD